MTRDELHYLADHVNDEMFDRIHALREQVKVLSEEKIHADRRINNQRKELKRKDERIKGLQEIIEDILDGAEDATVAPDPRDEALRVAEEALETVKARWTAWPPITDGTAHSAHLGQIVVSVDTALAAIRAAGGAR